jgi:hypothetical protein
MRKHEEEKDDLHVCKERIREILKEFNCEIETDDYHSAWIRDKDTNETTGVK